MKDVVNYIQLARVHDGERSNSRAGGEILEDLMKTGFHAVCFRCDQHSSRVTDSHLYPSWSRNPTTFRATAAVNFYRTVRYPRTKRAMSGTVFSVRCDLSLWKFRTKFVRRRVRGIRLCWLRISRFYTHCFDKLLFGYFETSLRVGNVKKS
jgi:hypothetical protein